MGINVPTEYGGSGLDMVSYAAAIIELAKADASIAITMAAHTSLGTLPILLYGSASLKKKYLPKIASGETLSAFGLTEPQAGSDAGSTKTTAIKLGDDYIVNGGKIFITNAGEAGVLSFTARVVEDGKDLGLEFLLFQLIRRIRNWNKRKKMGWRASDTRQIYFKNMKINLQICYVHLKLGSKLF